MVDIEAAIGYVLAHGDDVDRARVGWLVSRRQPGAEALAKAEMGQLTTGGWPAFRGSDLASLDATCFRLAELDDLGALGRPAARRALDWLAARQRPDGTWEEDPALAGSAPEWARPGDPEARLYLTANAGYWLAVERAGSAGAAAGDVTGAGSPAAGEPPDRDAVVARAAGAFRAALTPDGRWPSFLMAGWYGAGLLLLTGWYYESAHIRVTLTRRVDDLSAADLALMGAVLRRAGLPDDDSALVAVRDRLNATQRADGAWTSDDGPALDVHTTVAAIHALA